MDMRNLKIELSELCMMGSGYVSRIQVACTKGMDSRTQAPSPKAVDFDFSEVDSATGTRLRQVRLVTMPLSPSCNFRFVSDQFCLSASGYQLGLCSPMLVRLHLKHEKPALL